MLILRVTGSVNSYGAAGRHEHAGGAIGDSDSLTYGGMEEAGPVGDGIGIVAGKHVRVENAHEGHGATTPDMTVRLPVYGEQRKSGRAPQPAIQLPGSPHRRLRRAPG